MVITKHSLLQCKTETHFTQNERKCHQHFEISFSSMMFDKCFQLSSVFDEREENNHAVFYSF